MSYSLAEVKFNGGRGTVLCNVCHVMLCDSCDTSHQIDCYHICEECYKEMNAENFSKLRNFVLFIANDYIELSHEKVRLQRDDYVRMAKKLLDELEECPGEGKCQDPGCPANYAEWENDEDLL